MSLNGAVKKFIFTCLCILNFHDWVQRIKSEQRRGARTVNADEQLSSLVQCLQFIAQYLYQISLTWLDRDSKCESVRREW